MYAVLVFISFILAGIKINAAFNFFYVMRFFKVPEYIFRSDIHFDQRSGKILAILVEGHPRNISMKIFLNQAFGLRGYVV